MAQSIEQEIAKLKRNLESIRLPHKLNKYRSIQNQIDSIQKLATDSNNLGKFTDQISELQDRLDKSVLCGVSECFICNNGAGSSGSSSFVKQNPVYSRSKSSNYVSSSRGVWSLSNNSRPKTTINNRQSNNNENIKENLPQLKSYNKQISLQASNNYNRPAVIEPADQLIASIAQIKLDNDKVDQMPEPVESNDSVSDTALSDVDQSIETKQTETISPSMVENSCNTNGNNEIDSSTNHQIKPKPKPNQPIDKSRISTMPRMSTGSIGTSIKFFDNTSERGEIRGNSMAPRLSTGSIGLPQTTTNSYKAYKDFINNYRGKNDQLEQSHT